jgi:CHAT domain-containing protein
MTRPYAEGTVAVVAGPRLAGADAEARAVAMIHGVDALTGHRATASATARHVSGAGLWHLAAHARLSPDAPLFSSFTLADGPLYVHDLERLAGLPHTVVLAACDAGRNAVLAGDELVGLSAAFLGGGSAQLVAPVVEIPDHETGALMAALHGELREDPAWPTPWRRYNDGSPTSLPRRSRPLLHSCASARASFLHRRPRSRLQYPLPGAGRTHGRPPA